MPEQMTMGQMLHFTKHLKFIKKAFPYAPLRNKALWVVMKQLEDEFEIPVYNTDEFAKQYPGVMEIYLEFNEACRL